MTSVQITNLTPVLAVDRIEPVLDFWARVGFEKVVDVPEEGGIGFVILADGTSQVMYQTRGSIAEDIPALADVAGTTFLFVKVASLDAVELALAGEPVFLPRRQTFYGSTEIGYREPGGHYVVFAEFPEDKG